VTDRRAGRPADLKRRASARIPSMGIRPPAAGSRSFVRLEARGPVDERTRRASRPFAVFWQQGERPAGCGGPGDL